LAVIGLAAFRRDFQDGLSLWGSRPFWSLAWTFGGLVGIMLADTAAALIPYALGADDPPNVGRVIALVEQRGLAFAAVGVGLSGPLVEEIVYRLVLVGRASSRVPMWVCLPASSLLFAAIHLGGFSPIAASAVLPHLTIGLGLAVIYWRTRNITITVAIHVLYNLMGLLTLAASLP
jgi:membrane protease YdiL (CAAX protease family)